MDRFPDKILSAIFGKLPDKERDGVDMACRRFHAIMEPIRFRSIDIKTTKQLELFVRSIIQNPRLPQHVQHAKIMWLPKEAKKHVVPEHWRSGLLVTNQYLNEKIAGNTSSAERLHTILCRNWDEYPVADYGVIGEKEELWLRNEIEGVLVSLLFKTLTNLIELSLVTAAELTCAVDHCPGQRMMYAGRITEGVLPKLRRITRAEGPRCHCPSAQMLETTMWLRHPSIEAFTYSPSRYNPYSSPTLPLDWILSYMGTSNVKVFTYAGPMKWHLLEQILILPRGLTEIHFPLLGPCASFDSLSHRTEGWFHRSLSQTLLQQAHSLRILKIRFGGWPDFVKEVTDLNLGKTFLGLTKLEELVAPINLLLGPDPAKKLVLSTILPPSLRSLTIWPQDKTGRTQKLLWDDQACTEALKIGLRKIISQCPSIQEVVLRCFTEKSSVGNLRSLIKNPKVKRILIS
jgi:hypothetical protein